MYLFCPCGCQCTSLPWSVKELLCIAQDVLVYRRGSSDRWDWIMCWSMEKILARSCTVSCRLHYWQSLTIRLISSNFFFFKLHFSSPPTDIFSASCPYVMILKLLLAVKKPIAARSAWDPVILKFMHLHLLEYCLHDLMPNEIPLELFLVVLQWHISTWVSKQQHFTRTMKFLWFVFELWILI